MAELVLVKLCSLDEVRGVAHLNIVEVDLDLPAAAASTRVVQHVLVQLDQRVVGGLGADVKHQSVFGLNILANALEEPLVRVNFAVVAMLDPEHKVDPMGF